MTDHIGSIVFYSFICMILLCFARNIDKKRKTVFFLWMIILILTFVSGLRHQTVGTDTMGYVSIISRLRSGYYPRINNITEQGFLLLSYILVNLSEGYTLALVVYAFITNALILWRLYDYRDKISFMWAVFLYYMLFYFTTFNTIRQWMAIAIVFFGTRYISNHVKAIIKYTVIVVLATLMHSTAVLAIFFVPLYYYSLPSKKVRVLIGRGIITVLMFVGAAYVYDMLLLRYGGIYLSSTNYGEVSYVNLVLLLYFCFIILYDNNGRLIIRKRSKIKKSSNEKKIRYESLAYLVGILLTLMVYFFRYADRIGQFFILFEIVFLPYYIKKPKTRTFTITFVLMLCVYLRFSSFASGGYGELPYIPFWVD